MFAFIILSRPTLAQEFTQSAVAITVNDQAGAVIPGARVTATNRDTGVIHNSDTNSLGEALIQLDFGIYTIRVQARGFKTWEEDGVGVTASISKTVTLPIAQGSCSVQCDWVFPVEIPIERADIADELPLMLLHLFDPLRSRPPRHRN